MKNNYYDPMFYLCSERMPFNVRIEFNMRDEIDASALSCAANTAIKRYPYFSIRIEKSGEEYVTVKNSLPIAVYEFKNNAFPLGGDEVNNHLLALSYSGKTINFYVSHVITDGAGFMPYVKSVLYHYVSKKYGIVPEKGDISIDENDYSDIEIENPFPEEKMEKAVPLFIKKCENFYKFSDNDSDFCDKNRKIFRFSVDKAHFTDYSFDNDGSPCSFVATLMAEAIWKSNPDLDKNIVAAVSFNMRRKLGCDKNYRMLCSNLYYDYPASLKSKAVSTICTCCRGMVFIQSDQQNVLFLANERKKLLESLDSYPTLDEKKSFLSECAVKDSTDTTFSISFVGEVNFAGLKPYIESSYYMTDGATYRNMLIEIADFGGRLYFSIIQGMNSDKYYKALLEQFSVCGIDYIEHDSGYAHIPDLILPD